MLSEDIGGGLELQPVVGTLGVVPQQPAEQFIVEAEQVTEQQVFMVVDKLVLDGAVKALAMGIRLRRLRVGVPVEQALRADRLMEVFSELGAVVGEHPLDGKGE
jgi:hypothetical protein